MVALALVALASFAAFKAGKSKGAARFNLVGLVFFLVYSLIFWGNKLSDGFDLATDLPLALCDVIYLLCLFCLIKAEKRMLTYAVYWGLAGTLQAMITPDLQTGFPSAEFVWFFIGHSSIVICIFFLLSYKPQGELAGWPGWRDASLGLLGYTFIVGLFDAVCQLNYGYLMEKPAGASVLDYFGKWPFYVLGGLIVAFFLFSILAVLLRFLELDDE